MDKLIPAFPYHVQNHVIFVPGLTGDAHTTWINIDSTPEFNWPFELQCGLKQTAVWKFEYSSLSEISDIAYELLKQIKKLKLNQSTKIVFVAHSLGGIVVKELKRILSNSRTDRDILKYIKGVVFISTPHFGSELAEFPRKFSPIYLMVNKNTVKVLNLDNSDLIKLDEKYIDIISDYYNTNDTNKIIICDFFETTKANIYENLPESFIVKYLVSNYEFIKKLCVRNVDELEDILVVDRRLQREDDRAYSGFISDVKDADHFSISRPKDDNNIIHRKIKYILNSNDMK